MASALVVIGVCEIPPTTVIGALDLFETGQWRIQDFPEGGAPTDKSAIILQFFAENCMKMKEFGFGGGRTSMAPPSLDPPMQVVIHFFCDQG